MFTIEQLRRIMPALSPAKAGAFLPFLQSAMGEFAIGAPARSAAFLAQLAHESGQFRFMEEIWGPTPAQSRYEPQSTLAARLGNTDAGDGKRFKGRGPIQVTGRANYRRYGDLLGVDLVADPPRAGDPSVAFRVAALFWSRNGLNELADERTGEAFRQITRRINGGFNGLAERQQFFARACEVLGVPVARAGGPRGLRPSAPAPEPFGRGAEAIRPIARRLSAPRDMPVTAGATPARRSPVARTAAVVDSATGPSRARPSSKAVDPAMANAGTTVPTRRATRKK